MHEKEKTKKEKPKLQIDFEENIGFYAATVERKKGYDIPCGVSGHTGKFTPFGGGREKGRRMIVFYLNTLELNENFRLVVTGSYGKME